jgi:hypothetical protein
MLSEHAAGECRIDRLSGDNLSRLEDLYRSVYGRPPAAGYFQKKYDTGYTGAAWLGYVACNNENIVVAYYGVMPCLISYGGGIVLAAQSGDTMTHPGHRYKGLFVELSKMTFALCRREGVRLLFGFPNQNSYHGAVAKLGWKQTETMDCFIIPVPTLPLAGAARRIPILGRLYKAWSRFIFGRHSLRQRTMPNSVIEDGYNGVLRSDRYMDYKTYSDNRVIRVGEALVWLKAGPDLVVGDLALANADFDATFSALRRMAFLTGLRQITFHASPGTRLHRLLAGRYPAMPSFPVLFQDFDSGLAPETIKFTFGDIDIF